MAAAASASASALTAQHSVPLLHSRIAAAVAQIACERRRGRTRQVDNWTDRHRRAAGRQLYRRTDRQTDNQPSRARQPNDNYGATITKQRASQQTYTKGTWSDSSRVFRSLPPASLGVIVDTVRFHSEIERPPSTYSGRCIPT